jgi:hypothetical protein
MQGRYLTVVFLCAFSSLVSAQVYRCTDNLGAVSFQDAPCDSAQQTVLRQVESQAPATGLRAGEKAWLKRLQKRPKPKRQKSTRSTSSAQRQDRRCWKKRRQLDEVRARLRRGYKPAQGDALRRKRRAYEDYLFRYCG